MTQEIKLPDLGEGIESAEVSEVSVSVGDSVEPNQTIAVLESEKASMEIPAEVSGTIVEVLISAGGEIKPGQTMMKVEVAGEELQESIEKEEKESGAKPHRNSGMSHAEKEIKLPDLGEGIESAEVSEVSVSVGDSVEPNQTIAVLESEKASMEIPAEVSGTIVEVLISAGGEIKPGQTMMKVEVAGEEPQESIEKEEKETTPKPEKKPKTETIENMVQSKTSRGVFASPGVRRLARELNINLETLKGSGPKGRITKEDLNGFIRLQMAISSKSIPAPKKEIDFKVWGNVETQKLTKIKRITGERTQQAWQTIPHVTQFDEADITDLDEYRKTLKPKAKAKGIKITFLPFLMKAVAEVLKELPIFNSSLDYSEENLVLKNYYHIGIAVDTPGGLTVPVVKDVDLKSIEELSTELMDISVRARDKKLKPDEMSGGTFTISSLGGIGGTFFTPIVNPPEVAIMGVSKSSWKKLYDHKTKTELPRYILPFSLSYDHRVIDGAAAALFTSKFAKALANPSSFKDEE